MKNIIVIAAIVILTGACNGSGKKNNNTMDSTSVGNSSMLDSISYYQSRRDQVRVQIDSLKEIVPEKENLKTEWREGVNKLEGEFYSLNEKMKKLETSTNQTWNNLKLEVDSAIVSMDTTIQNMKLKLKKVKV
jgi:chromosome segregation ATPase